MLIEQSTKFELRGLGPLAEHELLNWLFSWETKFSHGRSSSGLLFTAKILQEAGILLFPTRAKSLTKLNAKMQGFKHVLSLNCKKKENWTI